MPSRSEIAQTLSSGPVDPGIAASSVRSAMRGEPLVFNVTNTSTTFNVPPTWKNRYVAVIPEGAKVYYQISTGLDAVADDTVVSGAVTASGRVTLTPATPPNECIPLQDGVERSLWFPQEAQTFAMKTASGTCKVRAHLAET
ncbi:MAG TPA: hypothetical protein VFZ61_26820 [Polyangiales bacterium]